MPQAVSSLSSIAKPTGPVTRFLPDLSSKFGSSGESGASPKSALAFANFTRAGLASPSAAAASTRNSVSAFVPLNERPVRRAAGSGR